MNIPDPTRIYKPEQLMVNNRKLYVYAWKRGNEWLYVGCSGQPLLRIIRHNVIGRADEVKEDDDFYFWEFSDSTEAFNFEARLMRSMNSKFNTEKDAYKGDRKCKVVVCRGCGESFMQKRYWQTSCSSNCRNQARSL